MSLAQFTFEFTGEDTEVGYLSKDLEFFFQVKSLNSSSPQVLRWRIIENDFPSSAWTDYTCDVYCYTSTTRTNDITLKPDTNFPIIHHVSMNEIHGMGTSTICFFDPNDSANTIVCRTVVAYSTPMLLEDTLSVSLTGLVVIQGLVYRVNGSVYSLYTESYILDGQSHQFVVIDGVVYDFLNGEFVPYEDETEIEVRGISYHIIDGIAFTKSGFVYTAFGPYKEIRISNQDLVILNGDTFEMLDGIYVPLGVTNLDPNKTPLGQNQPNPFRGLAWVHYSVPQEHNNLQIHDLTGKLIETISLPESQGKVSIGANLNTGIYFYSLWSEGILIDTKRMQVIR